MIHPFEPVSIRDWALTEFSAAPGIVILPQNRTEAILHDAVLHTNQSDVRFGHGLVGFTPDADSVQVRVEPQDGPPYELRASFLVGCDGPHSTVRRWSLSPPRTKPSGGRSFSRTSIATPIC